VHPESIRTCAGCPSQNAIKVDARGDCDMECKHIGRMSVDWPVSASEQPLTENFDNSLVLVAVVPVGLELA